MIVIFFPNLNLPVRGFYAKPVLPTSNQTSQGLTNGAAIESIKNIVFGEQVSSSNQTALSGFQQGEQANSGLPVRLKIPKINVDSKLEYVGITPQGAVGAPKDPGNAAWLDLGPRPGEKGNSIIVGHFGWKNGIPAVFDYLYTLRKGDKLYVEDEKGATVTFIVRELRTYGENEDASDVFSSSDGKAHLNLITCEGVWNKVSKSYSERLVVFTDKE
ncbi:MAG: class F sortase [Candidatus Jorgensenbacteria bacterium]|nr:class F sortase [Candidatus Jorgensenbacteria bacterium]